MSFIFDWSLSVNSQNISCDRTGLDVVMGKKGPAAESVLVLTRTKHCTKRVAMQMRAAGFPA